jgi:hypothetical protein
MEYGPSQIAFIKQGYGHFVESTGDEPVNAPEPRPVRRNLGGDGSLAKSETRNRSPC